MICPTTGRQVGSGAPKCVCGGGGWEDLSHNLKTSRFRGAKVCVWGGGGRICPTTWRQVGSGAPKCVCGGWGGGWGGRI